MANRIEDTLFKPQDGYVTQVSRYAKSKVIYYGDRRCLTFNTYKRKDWKPNQKDRFMVVSAGYEFRPDLVSQQVYGIPDFWWKIMEVNGIKDIFDFKAGTNIRLPANVY